MIDYLLGPASEGGFELLLRSGVANLMQSLHRFSPQGESTVYDVPVLLCAPAEGGSAVVLEPGQVVEVGVRVEPGNPHRVCFPTMQVRESRKQPNFTWGAMHSHATPSAAGCDWPSGCHPRP